MEPLKTAMLCAYMECTEKELNEFLTNVVAKPFREVEREKYVLGLITDCENGGLEPTLANLEYMLNFNKHLKKT